MKVNKIICIVLCFCLTYNIFAQNSVKPIEYRFKKGESGLRDFLIKNIHYPYDSRSNGTIGFSISGISITPKGKIDSLYIINPIDELIDNEVLRVLRSSSRFWLKCDTISHDQAFFIQIAFIISGTKPNSSIINPVSYRFFIEPITVTDINLRDNAVLPQSDELLAIKCIVSVSSGRYNEALSFVNDLIKRNPFKKELYQYRITIRKKMDRQDLIDADIQKISSFANGLSLEEILNEK